MVGFLGEYESTLDSKGRFLLPGGLKKQLPDGETHLIISRGFEKCLNLYPKKTWETIIERINELDRFDPEVRQFKRYFLAGATEVELDSAGRMLLPPTLKEHAGLNKDILLSCDIDKIDIWDVNVYKEFFENFSAEKFSELAKKVMGTTAVVK